MELFKLFGSVLLKGGEETEKSLDKIDKKAEGTGGAFTKLGKIVGGLAIGAAVMSMAKNAVSGLMEMEDKTTQLESVLRSTGGAAGVTKEQVINMAEAFEKTTKFAAESTLEAQNLMLTFTNIGKEVFPMATETILDMATALGTDASGQAMQLGKALNDPINGVSALTRVGVTFTESQKKMIKKLQETGDMAGAQTVILKELQKEFGGSAEAAGNTLSGALTRAKNGFDSIVEGLLTSFMPAIQTAVDYVLENMPKIQKGFETVNKILGVFGAVLGFVAKNLNVIIPVLITFLSIWAAFKIITMIESLGKGIGVVTNMLTMMNPAMLKTVGIILLAVGAVTLLVLALSYLTGKGKDINNTIAAVRQTSLEGIKVPEVPQFATGINRVPGDMYAKIHKDEAIVPAQYNPYNPNAKVQGKTQSGGNTYNISVNARDLDEVSKLVRLFEEIESVNRQGASQFG